MEEVKKISFKNLLVLSGRFASNEIQEKVHDIIKKFKSELIDNGNMIVTTAKNTYMINNQQYIDLDVLVPLQKKIDVEDTGTYSFMDELYFEKAVCEHTSNISNIPIIFMELERYIQQNALKPNTSIYVVQHNREQTAEILIGIA